MEQFLSFDYTDFEERIELIKPNAAQLRPLILIPGVAGSKLVAQNKKTFEEDCAWIAASLKYCNKMAQYLWGITNPETHTFESFVSEWADITPLTGITGCDHIIDAALLDTKLFRGTSLDNYYGKLVTYLQSALGYEYLTNLFAFSYDWRQQLPHPLVMDSLRRLIKDIHKASHRKVTLIGHSLGGVLVETYMRVYPDWADDVDRFIALQTPFDGSSAYQNIAHLYGYTLKLPLSHSVCKGTEAAAGSQQYMMPYPMGNGPFSQVFIKRKQGEPIEHKMTPSNSRDLLLEDVQLNEHVYEKQIPDVCFAIAKRILNEPELISPDKRREVFEKLQACCKKRAILIEGVEQVLGEQKVEQAFEPDFKRCQITAQDLQDLDFVWEVYSPWGLSKTLRVPCRNYSYVQQKFVKVEHNSLIFSHRFRQIRAQNPLASEIRQSEFPDIRDYAQAQLYFDELATGINQISTDNVGCYCAAPQTKEAPWEDPASRAEAKERNLYDLVDECYKQGTLERLLYQPTPKNYELAAMTRVVPIDFSKAKDFRFISISGCGTPTPLHAVYQKPIKDAEELIAQRPSYVYVDGDGTVLLNAALHDPFPQEYVIDRIVVPGFEHFGALSSQRMFQLIVEALQAK